MIYKYTKAVVLGRFQPFHKGHAKLIHEALDLAKDVYIVIGSANCYPNIKNPFTVEQRIEVISDYAKNRFTMSQLNRTHFVSVNDYRYNDEKWKTEVRTKIDETEKDMICMIGFDKDADSYWLKEFGWHVHNVDPVCVLGTTLSATPYRENLLGALTPKNWLKSSVELILPKETLNFLEKFIKTDTFHRLQEEMLHYNKEAEKFKDYPYKGSMHFCTADAVVVCNNHLLVIERKFAPGKGAWALPGGHKNENETFKACAIRELLEEVKIKVPEKVLRGSIKANHLFDHPGRCAKFNKPTVAQYIIIEPNNDGSLPIVKGQDDAKSAHWIPMHEVIKNQNMFFDDHAEIVTFFTGI